MQSLCDYNPTRAVRAQSRRTSAMASGGRRGLLTPRPRCVSAPGLLQCRVVWLWPCPLHRDAASRTPVTPLCFGSREAQRASVLMVTHARSPGARGGPRGISRVVASMELVPPRKAPSDPFVESESLCPAGLLTRTLPINLSAVQRDGGVWGAQAAAARSSVWELAAGRRGGPPPPRWYKVHSSKRLKIKLRRPTSHQSQTAD